MAIRRPAAQIQPESGNNSQAIIGEQATWASEAEDETNAYAFQPLLTGMDIARSGTIIETNYFDGQSTMNKGLAGPLDIANGLTFSTSGNGTALFYRMLTQDLNPTRVELGDTDANAVDIVDGITITGSDPVSINIGSGIPGTSAGVNHPVRLLVTPQASSVLSAGRTNGFISLTGTDNNDTVFTENVFFYPASDFMSGLGKATYTQSYFKTLTAATATGWGTGSTVDISVQNQAAEVTFTPQDARIAAYWFAEIAKGNIPNVYRGLLLESASLALTRDAMISFECGFLGRKGVPYSNLGGDTESSAGRVEKTSAADLNFASPDIFAGWQATVEGAGLRIPVTDGTLTVTQNFEYTNVLGSRFQESPPVRGNKRSLTFESTFLYDERNNYSEFFENNRTIPNLSIVMLNEAACAFPHRFEFTIREAQLTADPDPAVAGFGVIPQTISVQAVSSTRGTPDFQIRCRFSEYAGTSVLPNRT